MMCRVTQTKHMKEIPSTTPYRPTKTRNGIKTEIVIIVKLEYHWQQLWSM